MITSGLPRTLETARIVVGQLDHPPTDPVLHGWPELEEFLPGNPDVIPDGELEDSFLVPFRGVPERDSAYLRGETVGSLFDRVSSAMERLFADATWDTVLLVLHGGVNRAIPSWVLAGRGPFLALLEQSPGCINLIDGEPEHFVLRAVNVTPYDPVHLGPRSTTVENILDQYRAYRRASL